MKSLDLHRFTPNTIVETSKLGIELKQVRNERISFDYEEYLVGVVCMAVPIGHADMLVAIAIQAPEARMNVRRLRQNLSELRLTADKFAKTFQERD